MRVEVGHAVRGILNNHPGRWRRVCRGVGIGRIIHDCGVELLCGTTYLCFSPAPYAVEDHAHTLAAPHYETKRIVV